MATDSPSQLVVEDSQNSPKADSQERIDQEVTAAREEIENKETRKVRAHFASLFEAFWRAKGPGPDGATRRPLSVSLVDDFLMTHSREGGRVNGVQKKASTMFTARSHLKKYILLQYRFNYESAAMDSFLRELDRKQAPVQAEIFEPEQITRFLCDAPATGVFLRQKLYVLCAYYGLCRCADLVDLTWDAVSIEAQQVRITIKRSKSAAAAANQQFVIPNVPGIDAVQLFKDFKEQTRKVDCPRVWIHFFDQWVARPVGKNTLADTGEAVATWLKLPNPARYTGHCWRRSGATAMLNAGATKEQVKRGGGWTSDTAVERYFGNTEREVQQQAQLLTLTAPPAVAATRAPQVLPAVGGSSVVLPSAASVSISGCHNCTIYIGCPPNK